MDTLCRQRKESCLISHARQLRGKPWWKTISSEKLSSNPQFEIASNLLTASPRDQGPKWLPDLTETHMPFLCLVCFFVLREPHSTPQACLAAHSLPQSDCELMAGLPQQPRFLEMAIQVSNTWHIASLDL